jgi:hypothetical protein
MKDSLTLYKELLNAIDLHFEKAVQLQKDEICCSKGCSSCCISDLTVCSIEAHYMKTAISDKIFNSSNISNAANANCIFLIDNECFIYDYRPVICRTQGLPLLYESDNEDEGDGEHEASKEKELSVCEKNFHNNISSETILDMEKLNTALIMINKMFENEQGAASDLFVKRFTFKEILKELKNNKHNKQILKIKKT